MTVLTPAADRVTATGKRLSTAAAKLAIEGFEHRALSDGTHTVSRWSGWFRTFDHLAALEAFVERVERAESWG